MIYIEDVMTMQLICAMIVFYVIGSVHGMMIGKYMECRRWLKDFSDRNPEEEKND